MIYYGVMIDKTVRAVMDTRSEGEDETRRDGTARDGDAKGGDGETVMSTSMVTLVARGGEARTRRGGDARGAKDDDADADDDGDADEDGDEGGGRRWARW